MHLLRVAAFVPLLVSSVVTECLAAPLSGGGPSWNLEGRGGLTAGADLPVSSPDWRVAGVVLVPPDYGNEAESEPVHRRAQPAAKGQNRDAIHYQSTTPGTVRPVVPVGSGRQAVVPQRAAAHGGVGSARFFKCRRASGQVVMRNIGCEGEESVVEELHR